MILWIIYLKSFKKLNYKIFKNIMFKSGFVNIYYFKVAYVLFNDSEW